MLGFCVFFFYEFGVHDRFTVRILFRYVRGNASYDPEKPGALCCSDQTGQTLGIVTQQFFRNRHRSTYFDGATVRTGELVSLYVCAERTSPDSLEPIRRTGQPFHLLVVHGAEEFEAVYLLAAFQLLLGTLAPFLASGQVFRNLG